MRPPLVKPPFLAANYLAWESEQTGKSDSYNDDVFTMSGAFRRHITETLNLAADLVNRLEGTPYLT